MALKYINIYKFIELKLKFRTAMINSDQLKAASEPTAKLEKIELPLELIIEFSVNTELPTYCPAIVYLITL